MSNEVNRTNKEKVWDFWQRMNHVEPVGVADLVRSAFHENVDWNASHPINQLVGVETLITGFYHPLRQSFPDLRRDPYVFMGGESGDERYVAATGYLTGTFVQDWLTIPATGERTNIRFGQFYVMREGKIVESYLILDLLAVMRQAGFQVLPPARGAEGGKIPGPSTGDGVLLTDQDGLESCKSFQLVEAMIDGLVRYDRDTLSSMEQKRYWHPQMHWYGPCGVGTCRSLEEFEDYHQRPFLQAFPDRPLDGGGGRRLGRIAEGHYVASGGWGWLQATHGGEYLGCPATGRRTSMRVMDFWRRAGDALMENWVPIDIVDIFQQFGVDLFDRLRQQIED